MENYNTIIIGGGIAGLTAALLLHKKGQRVAIFEKAGQGGGRAMTRQKGGFYLNFGPHALYRGGAGIRILKSLGIAPQGDAPKYGNQPLALTKNGDGLLPVTPKAMWNSELFAGKRLALARALLTLWSAKPSPQLMQTSWADWLERHTPAGIVRQQIEMTGRLTTYANAPQLMSAGATIAQIKMGLRANVLYLDQGWGQLLEALCRQIANAGIPLYLNAKVEELHPTPEQITIRLADGGECRADQAILAVPPQAAAELAPFSDALHAGIQALTPIRAACLTVGLRHLPNPDTMLAMGLDQPFYGVVHSESAQLAPPNHALIHATIYISPDDTRTPAEHKSMLEDGLSRMQPGWRDLIVEREYLPRLLVSHALIEAGRPRPPIDLPDAPNIYLAGDWVEAGGMLADNSLASAEKAVTIIAHEH